MLTAYLIFSICVNVTLLVFILFYARKNAIQAGEMAELRQTLDNADRKARNENRPEWGAEPGKLYFVITWEK